MLKSPLTLKVVFNSNPEKAKMKMNNFPVMDNDVSNNYINAFFYPDSIRPGVWIWNIGKIYGDMTSDDVAELFAPAKVSGTEMITVISEYGNRLQ